MKSKLIKNIAAYPILRRKFLEYIPGAHRLPAGFTPKKLFWDYLKVRRQNPGRRVSMSEYMIFGFYGLTLSQQQAFLTDVEATLLMRPYNSESEAILKDKVCFLRTFSQFIGRDWLYLPEASEAEFAAFAKKHPVMALKPPTSSWGIGFRKLDMSEVSDLRAAFTQLREGGYLAEEFLTSCPELAKYHPASLNTLRVITFVSGERFEVFGAGLRVGNGGRNVDNAHGGGIFCEVDAKTGVIITDGLDECGNEYVRHPVTGQSFRGQVIPRWDDIVELCRKASCAQPCLHVVGWDVAVLADGSLELIEGNHNPGMNIVQAPAKRGVKWKFQAMLKDFYGSELPPEEKEKP